jgi:hypothetical protein
MPAQGLEKRLKTAADEAAQGSPVYLDVADTRGALELSSGWRPDESDLHAMHWQRFCHVVQARDTGQR